MITSNQETESQRQPVSSEGSAAVPEYLSFLKAAEETSGASLGALSDPFEFDDLDRQLRAVMEQLHDEKLQEQVKRLLLGIRGAVMSLPASVFRSRGLPPLQATRLEDGSILVEWIFKDFRIGFNIDARPSESSWYLVSTRKLNQFNTSGAFSEASSREVISVLLNFALLNS